MKPKRPIGNGLKPRRPQGNILKAKTPPAQATVLTDAMPNPKDPHERF